MHEREYAIAKWTFDQIEKVDRFLRNDLETYGRWRKNVRREKVLN